MKATTGGEQFHTHDCCVLHITDTSQFACTKKHAYTDSLKLDAYAVHIETETEKRGRKKTQKPTERGA